MDKQRKGFNVVINVVLVSSIVMEYDESISPFWLKANFLV